MHRLSMVQALSVWTHLEAAYHGKNGFGGDTAEIYMYLMQSNNPSAESARRGQGGGTCLKALHEQIQETNESLCALLKHFVESRSDIRIEVDGKEMGDWVKTAGFDHRVHVRVVHTK